jgi:hypothetical protein
MEEVKQGTMESLNGPIKLLPSYVIALGKLYSKQTSHGLIRLTERQYSLAFAYKHCVTFRNNLRQHPFL